MSRARTTIHRFRHTYRSSSPSIPSSIATSLFQSHPRSSLLSFLSHPKHSPIPNPFHFHIHSSYFSSPPSSAPEQDSLGSDYPTGDFDYKPITGWKKSFVNLRMLIALPWWERIKHGSVLKITLGGKIISDTPPKMSILSMSEEELSLHEICDNFEKAAYDPRISGIYLHIDDTLNCGWAKVEEIRRHILNFRKSGKFVVAYVPSCREKEYYIACACEEIYAPPSAYFSLFGLTAETPFVRGVLDNLGIEPQVERIGKYKSAGDHLTHRTMSEDNRELLTALLDDIYSNWLDKVSSARGKKREDIENFINEGVYQVDSLKEKGFISSIRYEDEVIATMKERLGVEMNKNLPTVDFRKYSRVRRWTVGISGGNEMIAIIRASGSIHHNECITSTGIVGEKFIKKIRSVRESKEYKAAIIRIDSPGGDALASDLMWREIRLLAASKPVIASLSDVAASGGYYMAMGAGAIVAESLTLTGSIGVVTERFNLGRLYEKIGFNKEIISRGRYAELLTADHRSLRPDEAELFAKSAQHIYKQFRDKAAFSRSMTVEKMEEIAQGRVWTGKGAAFHGLVDAIGGFSRAIAIAKLKANIPQDRQVTLVELSEPSLPETLSSLGCSLVGVGTTLKELRGDLTFSDRVQARMDGIMFQKLGDPSAKPTLALLRDYLSSK